jgi:hypothetical protein
MARVSGTLGVRISTMIKSMAAAHLRDVAPPDRLAEIEDTAAFAGTALRDVERARQNMISEGSPIHAPTALASPARGQRAGLASASVIPPVRC